MKRNPNLTPEEIHILFEKGTEPPFTGEYLHYTKEGTYNCKNCGKKLFHSSKKYNSKSGWPSFWDTIADEKIELIHDLSHGMNRIEVVCSNCKGHLGHLFSDGPEPTRKRYCINSLSLQFNEESNEHSPHPN